MDLQKLTDLVTQEAKKEADFLLDNAKKRLEDFLASEKQLIKHNQNEKMQEETDQNNSKLNYLRFNLESEYKKKVLHLRFNIMEELRSKLNSALLETIRKEPYRYLELVLKDLNTENANFFINSHLEGIVTSDLVQQYNREHGTSFTWKGLDSTIDPGIGLEQGTIRYIFPLEEIVSHFLDKHSSEINEKFYA